MSALSEHVIVEVKQDGKVYRQEYKRGIPLYPVKKVEKSQLNFPFANGTAVSFLPDKEIFRETNEINYNTFKKQIKERAYLISGVYFRIFNNKEHDKTALYFDGGIISLLRDINREKKVLHEPIRIVKQVEDKEVEVALQYNDSISEKKIEAAGGKVELK